MDGRVEQGGQDEAEAGLGRRRDALLEEPPPEELLAGPDDEADEQSDPEDGGSFLQGIDAVDPGRGEREDPQGDDAPDGKYGVEASPIKIF
jgi:hypothetical protein